tara:strand:+ start:1406 stop:2800 length:1395 start_codon:yes stop_codon:yes gene_type:complete
VLAQPDERHDNSVMTYEIELKLRFAPDKTAALQQALDSRATRGGHSTLNNTYFDTEEGALSRQTCALRIRQKGETAFEQTLKTLGSSQGGLTVRHEWNWPLDQGQLDASLLASDEVLGHWPEGISADSLMPLFNTHFERQRWIWQLGQSEVEIVLDQGLVQAQGAEIPLCELELELLQGDPAVIWRMAEALCAEVPLWISDISKAERGYRLLGLGRDWQQPGDVFEVGVDFANLPDQLNNCFEWIKRALETLLWEAPPPTTQLAVGFAAHLLAFFTLARLEPSYRQCLPTVTLVNPSLALTSACLVRTEFAQQSPVVQCAVTDIAEWRDQPMLAQTLLKLGRWLWQLQTSTSTPLPQQGKMTFDRLLAQCQSDPEHRGAGLEQPQRLVEWMLLDDGLALTSRWHHDVRTSAAELLGLQLELTAIRHYTPTLNSEDWRQRCQQRDDRRLHLSSLLIQLSEQRPLV